MGGGDCWYRVKRGERGACLKFRKRGQRMEKKVGGEEL